MLLDHLHGLDFRRLSLTQRIGIHYNFDRVQLRDVDDSLKRLRLEVIDLYQIHWPDPDEDIEEAWGTVADLVEQGKIRFGGVSNFGVSQLDRIKDIHPVASLQPPYSMLRRNVEEELLAYCGENRIGVIAYSPMQKGLLTGKFSRERAAELPENDHRRNDPDFQEPKLGATLALVDGLTAIAGRSGHTPAQLAVAWVLRRPEITAAIVGARRTQQIEETATAGNWTLAAEEVEEIENLLRSWKRQSP